MSNNKIYLPEGWGTEWDTWWRDILVSQWPDAENIKINSKLDNK
mgnify:FL=1